MNKLYSVSFEYLEDREITRPSEIKRAVELLSHMGSDKTIAQSARVSYDNDISKGDEQDSKLIDYLTRNEHMSPFEMAQLKLKIRAPIYIARQWMRHRTGSYNEVSRRYTSENMYFFIPINFITTNDEAKNKQKGKSIADPLKEAEKADKILRNSKNALEVYKKLINDGVSKETARMVLPLNLMTTFHWSVNLRNLFHFIKLRIAEDAQLEIREYASRLLNICKDKFPISTYSFIRINKLES